MCVCGSTVLWRPKVAEQRLCRHVHPMPEWAKPCPFPTLPDRCKSAQYIERANIRRFPRSRQECSEADFAFDVHGSHVGFQLRFGNTSSSLSLRTLALLLRFCALQRGGSAAKGDFMTQKNSGGAWVVETFQGCIEGLGMRKKSGEKLTLPPPIVKSIDGYVRKTVVGSGCEAGQEVGTVVEG